MKQSDIELELSPGTYETNPPGEKSQAKRGLR